MAECARGEIDFRLGESVNSVASIDGAYQVSTNAGVLWAPSLVIATGGPSIPKLGATGLAYDLARQFGLKVVEPRPALVPLTLGGEETLFRTLSGVAAPVVASAGGARFREAALFTHRGLSGPAILQASSYWRHGAAVDIDFMPGADRGWLLSAKREKPRATMRTILSAHLPARLAEALAERIHQVGGEVGQASDRTLSAIEAMLAAWAFHPNGSEGLAKAEVTAGGIATAGMSSRTMEARDVPGLYAIGEAVDVTGWLGGYNFQWAWASGWAAGQAIRRANA
jgi:predicted Rossmann fold flavoprotein